MLRPVFSSARLALALIPLLALGQRSDLQRKGDSWEKDFIGNARAMRRVRVVAHGPVTVQAGLGQQQITYSVRVSVRARTEAEARQVMQRYKVEAQYVGDTLVITAPGGPVISNVMVKTPRLDFAEVKTSDGNVETTGVDGGVVVDTGAGELVADRIRGDCKLNTGGGDVRVGSVGGTLRCTSQAGKITVGTVKGEAVLKTI